MQSLIGHHLGRYHIESSIDVGGMGAVYKAYQPALARTVAIKVMHVQYGQHEEFRKRFQQEARTAAQLNHPGIVTVHDFDEVDDLLYIVMEFIPGKNLKKQLDAMLGQRQWIVLPQAINLVCQVAIALDFAHRHGVLHRDIKPANIMLKEETDNPGHFKPIITDLGLAKLAGGLITTPNSTMGTPAYMSPEQAKGLETDQRSDIYSLGVLLYELTVGQRPFPIESLTEAIRYHGTEPPPPPRAINPNLPASVERIILRAMEKDPAQRFATMRELAQALLTLPPADLPNTVPSAAVNGSRRFVILEQNRLTSEPPKPTMMGAPPILEITAPDSTRRTVEMKGSTLTIGRSDNNDLILNDERVSRHHAKLDFDGSRTRVTDLGSRNGTSLAGTDLLPNVAEVWQTSAPLRVGDHTLRQVAAGSGPLPSQPFTDSQPVSDGSTASAGPPPTIPAYGPTAWSEAPPTVPAPDMLNGRVVTTAAAKRMRRSPVVAGLILIVFAALLFMLWQRGSGGANTLGAVIALVFPQNAPDSTPTAERAVPSSTPTSNTPDEPEETPTHPSGNPNGAVNPPPTDTPLPTDENLTSVPIGPLPDLAIAQMVLTPDKNECGSDAGLGVQVLIINKGDSVAPEFIIQINSERLRVEAGLEPGQTVRVWVPDPGETNKLTLDPSNKVKERYKDNNAMSIGREATVIPTCEPTATDIPTPTWTSTPSPTTAPTDTPTPSSTPTAKPKPKQPPTPTITPTPVPPLAPVGELPLQFAFVRGNIGNTDIYVYDMATGSVKAAVANSTCDEAELRWAPSGTSILYHANCNGSYDIYTVDVASGAVDRLTSTNQFDEWEPNLTTDHVLIYRRTQAKTTRDTADAPIYLQSSTGDVSSFGLSGRSPIVSPDGAKMVYMSAVSGTWQIYVYDANSGQSQLISTNCPRHCRWPTWLPDSTAVSYTASTDDFVPTGIWIAPLGEEPWEWLHGDVGRAAWSDSGQVVFDTAAGIEVSDFQGNNRRVVVQSTNNWAPYWNH